MNKSSDKRYKILLTGGGSGIGAAIAKSLNEEGHSVMICGRRIKKLREVAETNRNVCYFVCDVSNEENVIELRDYFRTKFGYVDVVINCAGIQGEIGRFDETDSGKWKKTFEVNLFGTYLITKYFLELLLKSNVKKIINFAGGGAFSSFPNYSAYAVSKAAVVRFTENIAEELLDFDIHVNCVAPGFVATEIHKATLDAGEKKASRDYFKYTFDKLKKGSVPVEIPVNCVRFLISSKSDGLTGKTISASFDKWDSEEFEKCIHRIVKSELFTMRRINIRNLDEKDEMKGRLSE